ncbi:TRAP transporter small permease subunit [Granulosicoccus sp.]|nr:TRAP transporter small permease subunit [Granulosicoccus sp.]MDB4223280.1 TRAP transporter small permease subunit [Granulosicoccus sp.]
MGLLNFPIAVLGRINTFIGSICRGVSVMFIAVMVLAILIQVFFRYVIGNALPWPDELARFCMLWMTGLMAPVAYREGGFVAIDMLPDMLGRRTAAALALVLFLVSLLVLVIGVKLGLKHVNSGWLFSSSSLKIPLDLIGMKSIKVKLVFMYSSLWIGLILLTVVNVELILRSIRGLIMGDSANSDESSNNIFVTDTGAN